MKECVQCGAVLEDSDIGCKYCGRNENTVQNQDQQSYQPPRYPDPPGYGATGNQGEPANGPQGYGQAPQYGQVPPQYGPPPQYGQAPQYGPPPGYPPQHDPNVPPNYNYFYYTEKSKVAAGLFGILLGGFGVHKFYLGKIGLGIVYVLFCWSGIPAIIGIIEGIIYLTMDDNVFREKYCKVFR